MAPEPALLEPPARPLSADRTRADRSPALARLRDPAAIADNRAGRLAPSQASRLRRRLAFGVVGYIACGGLAFTLYLVQSEVTGPPGVVLGVVVALALALVLLVRVVLPRVADLRSGRVDHVAGRVAKTSSVLADVWSTRQHHLEIGGRRFRVGTHVYDAIAAEEDVTAYFLTRTGELLTLEASSGGPSAA